MYRFLADFFPRLTAMEEDSSLARFENCTHINIEALPTRTDSSLDDSAFYRSLPASIRGIERPTLFSTVLMSECL